MANPGSGEAPGVAAAPNRERLSHYLGDMLPSVGRVRELHRLTGGQSNPTFLVRCERGTVILRAKPAPASKLLPSAHAIEREFAVMQALAETGFPVPEVLVLCLDEDMLGTAFYVMQFVDGRILRDPTLPAIVPAERTQVYDAMNRTIAALHAIDPAFVGLTDFGAQGNYLERQIRRWTRQYRASATDDIPSMDRLIDWLPNHVPESSDRRIVHGDFRMENLILDPVEARVLAVIDWELSTIGDPVADFAYHCLPWHMPTGESKGIGTLDPRELGIPSEVQYRAMYAERTGRDIDATWHVYIAFNFFRLAAILQGVYKRALEGRATSDAGMRAGARARAMADRGWSIAQPG
jgi:aminoglycoside phosphotransferase (APT) family kinase protein